MTLKKTVTEANKYLFLINIHIPKKQVTNATSSLTIKDKIKPLNSQIKVLKDKKVDLQKVICEFMVSNEIDECKLNSGKLEYKESQTVKPINKASVFDKINQFFSNNFDEEFKQLPSDEKAKVLHTFIYETAREYTPKTFLKRKT